LCAAAGLVNETLRTCNPLESLPSPSRQQHAVHQLGSNDLDSSVNNDASGHDRPFIRYWGSRASPIGLIMLGTIAAYFLLSLSSSLNGRPHEGFPLQWPNLLSLPMFPVLLVMYARLALREEAEVHDRLGEQYEAWATRTLRFLPAPRRPAPAGHLTGAFEGMANRPPRKFALWKGLS
jgi:hypothetical protein